MKETRRGSLGHSIEQGRLITGRGAEAGGERLTTRRIDSVKKSRGTEDAIVADQHCSSEHHYAACLSHRELVVLTSILS